ncbi:hypothetical protein EMCRGX_G008268 [Ephydatia muelleri]
MDNQPPNLPPRRIGSAEDKALPPLHPKPKASNSSFFPRDQDAHEPAAIPSSRRATCRSPSPQQPQRKAFHEASLSLLREAPPLTEEAPPLPADAPPIPPKPTPSHIRYPSTEHFTPGYQNVGSSQPSPILSPSSVESHTTSTPTLLLPLKTDTSSLSRRKSRERHTSLPVSMDDEWRPAMPSREPHILSQDNIAERGTRLSIELPPGKDSAFSIDKFTTSYAHLLPTRVIVEQGYFDFERNFGVTTGEVYNLHFIKKVKSVSVSDSNSQRHVLPLNACVEYCLLHDPDGDRERARAGYTYRRAGDIMALKTLPAVVRAKSAYRGGDAASSVEALEMLVVLQVAKKHKFMRNRVLSVFSLTNSTKKALSEECEGNFSTDPYGTKLFLPEIIQHLPNAFPTTALMFVSPDVTHNIPLHLFDEFLVLEGLVESRSIIATTCDLPNSSSPSQCVRNLIEFPVSLPITVTLLDEEEEEEGGGSDDSSASSLFSRTRNIIEGFDPSKVSTYAISVEARKGHEMLGLEVEAPHYQALSSPARRERPVEVEECGTYTLITKDMTMPAHATQDEGNVGEQRYEPAHAGKDDYIGRRKRTVGESGESASAGIASTAEGPTDPERILALEQQMEEVKRTTLALGNGLQGVQTSTEASLVRLEKQLLEISRQLQKLEWMTGGSVDNKFELTPNLLSVDQVGELLDALGLQQYKAIFKEENIDGEVFVNLTDEILESNLYINSPQDRMKLMRVIQGTCAIPVYLIPIKQ